MTSHHLALSLYSPWAWALMFAKKDVENRSLAFPRRRNGEPVFGRVWVHASASTPWGGLCGIKAHTEVMLETLWSARGWMSFDAYDMRTDAHALLERTMGAEFAGVNPTKARLLGMRGHIVGSVEVCGYKTPDAPPNSPWYVDGSLAIMVRNPRPLAHPVPARGARGWWRPDDATLRHLSEAS